MNPVDIIGKNQAVRRLLEGSESQLIDRRPGAHSLWLGPHPPTTAKPKRNPNWKKIPPANACNVRYAIEGKPYRYFFDIG